MKNFHFFFSPFDDDDNPFVFFQSPPPKKTLKTTMVLLPNVKWAQRKDKLFLTIDIQVRLSAVELFERGTNAIEKTNGQLRRRRRRRRRRQQSRAPSVPSLSDLFLAVPSRRMERECPWGSCRRRAREISFDARGQQAADHHERRASKEKDASEASEKKKTENNHRRVFRRRCISISRLFAHCAGLLVIVRAACAK